MGVDQKILNNRDPLATAGDGLPGAKQWVYCTPCPDLTTHIALNAFSVLTLILFPGITLRPQHPMRQEQRPRNPGRFR